ncbi:MAG TPA: hypothetical protein VFB34_06290 [Chloroflexota bacterium]|nr:hypothetical protein [Chloroflexota bacterium]
MSESSPERAPTTDVLDPMEVAREDFKASLGKGRGRFSQRMCPNCGRRTLERKHLSPLLKVLRIIPGISPRRYHCYGCQAKMTLWRKAGV